MRFMVILKITPEVEKANAAKGPTEELLNAMGKLNSDMVKAGVLLSGEGLAPSDTGVKVTITTDEVVVLDGPFAESKELIAGFWLLQVSSREEAVEWVKRIPTEAGETDDRGRGAPDHGGRRLRRRVHPGGTGGRGEAAAADRRAAR